MYSSISDLLRQRRNETPDRVFVRLPGQQLTFADLDQDANRLADVFRQFGLARGEVVASMLPTSAAALAAWFATARTGTVQAPVNVAYQGDLLARQLHRTRARVVVTDTEHLPQIAAVVDRLPDLRHLLVVGIGAGAAQDAVSGLPVTDYDYAMAASSDEDHGLDGTRDDPSSIIFTSGTTGPSKAILRSHAADLAYARDAVRAMAYNEEDVQYLAFPLFHGFARYNGVLPLMMVSGTVVLLPRFSVSQFWTTCRRENVTCFAFLGATLRMLMKQPVSDRDRDHRVVKAHGAPVPAAALLEFQDRFGVNLIETYGSSELGIVTANTDGTPGSCGQTVDTYTVDIRDESGHSLPTGQTGEIAVRPRGASAMFSEYVGDAAGTEQALRGGWFHTGDVGHFDESGHLYFTDRKKDVIRRRGENISSWEVETAIGSHEGIHEVAAYGVPSDLTEEDVAVAVVPKAAYDLTAAAVIEHARAHLPGFAVPRYVLFVSDLPKTATGRVEKYRLREAGLKDAFDGEGQSSHS